MCDTPWELAPTGLAVIGTDARFLEVNATGSDILGRPASRLAGCRGPFPAPRDTSGRDVVESVAQWHGGTGRPVELHYRQRPGPEGRTVVAFRDMTAEREQQRRVAALARSSASLARLGSLSEVLDELAEEVLKADDLAAVQVLTVDDDSRLTLMGSAGFSHWPDFFDRILEARLRGARFHMLDVVDAGEPVFIEDRWPVIVEDPAWDPLVDYLGERPWSSFASVPLVVRQRVRGVLNAFYAPGRRLVPASRDFLLAMAEQAAVAVDYAALLRQERETARLEERQRWARDLHDSIVQHVFSISMQARSLQIIAQRGEPVGADTVADLAAEVGELAGVVSSDLRAMVHQLRPTAPVDDGLPEALRVLLDNVGRRSGVQVALEFEGDPADEGGSDGRRGDGDLDELPADLAEDVYRFAAEAVHNAVKHAHAQRIVLRVAAATHALRLVVTDDGAGFPARPTTGGLGLHTMRQRARRWGGDLEVGQATPRGTRVALRIPRPWQVRDEVATSARPSQHDPERRTT